MIVMKFGGASLASPSSIRRVVSIVRSQLTREPVVVVSALGDTTDHLLEILSCASRANCYLGWKSLEQLQTYHLCLVEDLLSGPELAEIETYLGQTFRDLHVRMLELSEGERSLTPELQDWVVSLGEQISSRITAAVLLSSGIPSFHVDGRSLILTNANFTNAEPRLWESYARIRWSLPSSARKQVAVIGGFIGATEDGCTTTLGRGGSDLTASLVGAALNAEEVQVWKDVDGLLAWDPRIQNGKSFRLKQLSYAEMADLASAGATILHPNTIAPIQRLRIPVIIRNTFRPECEGTRIGASSPGALGTVKSIACKTDVTLLELRSSDRTGVQQYADYLETFCRQRASAATLLGVCSGVIYLGLEKNVRTEELAFDLDQCAEVHVRSQQAILTLVGEGVRDSSVADRVLTALGPENAMILPPNGNPRRLCVAVPAKQLTSSLAALGRALYAHVDPLIFAASDRQVTAAQVPQTPAAITATGRARGRRRSDRSASLTARPALN